MGSHNVPSHGGDVVHQESDQHKDSGLPLGQIRAQGATGGQEPAGPRRRVHRDPSRLPRKGIPRSGRSADQRTLDSNEHETPLTVSKGQWDTHGSPKGSQEPGLEAGIEQTIKESIRETLAASREWVLEEIAVFAAHCFIPGAGHVVLLIFDVKDLLEDAAALTSSDRPVELHIPLVHLPPGVELEAGMGLSPQEGKDGPQLFLFLAPGDGGVLAGVSDDHGFLMPDHGLG
jgi:hypothetical protein